MTQSHLCSCHLCLLPVRSSPTLRLHQWPLSMACLVAQSCLTLCNSMDCSLTCSSDHRILQARILEWVACPSPGDHPNPGIELESLASPALAGMFLTTSAFSIEGSGLKEAGIGLSLTLCYIQSLNPQALPCLLSFTLVHLYSSFSFP